MPSARAECQLRSTGGDNCPWESYHGSMQKKTKVKVERLSPADIERELKVYEDKFGISTEDFVQKYERGEMGDSGEVILWRGLVLMRDTS